MKKKITISIIALVCFLVTAYFVYENITYVTTDNAQVGGHPVMLSAKVGGFVTQVNVQEGQKVKKGDILVEIQQSDYDNILQQIQGEFGSLDAKKKDAERNYNRVAELFQKKAVSPQQFDTATALLAELKARAQSLSAQVAQAKLNLENTKIIAPTDGFIAKKSVEVGQLASPGVPIIGFVDLTERWIIANFKETEISDIKINAPVNVEIDAYPSRKINGKVYSISSATGSTFTLLPPDNASGNFTKIVQRVPVKIILNDLSEHDIESFKVGLSATVKVHKQ